MILTVSQCLPLARLLKNKLKIISGKYKSRIIQILDKKNLKPTKSYIREVLFNIIDIHNCETSLDLFAGSGILSMEALSRGVKKSIVVESDKELVKSINGNLKLLDIRDAVVINKKVELFLNDLKPELFDIIFIDPPYDTSLLEYTLDYLKEHKFLRNNKYLYFERSKNDKTIYLKYIASTHNIVKDLSIGDVSYTIAINKNI